MTAVDAWADVAEAHSALSDIRALHEHLARCPEHAEMLRGEECFTVQANTPEEWRRLSERMTNHGELDEGRQVWAETPVGARFAFRVWAFTEHVREAL